MINKFIFPIIYGAHVTILLIVEVEILVLLEWSYRLS